MLATCPINLDDADFVIVFDGACPACTRFFPGYLGLLALRRRTTIVDARLRPDLIDYLRRTERIDIDRDAAVHWQGRWYAGAAALAVLFWASRQRNSFLRRASQMAFAAIYPGLRLGRRILLRARGVPLIQHP